MKTALIIHGAFGSPNENWIPWLKTELESQGYEVFTPVFPTPERQSLENWNAVLQDYLPKLNQASLLVGHSIGTVFALSVLEQLDEPVKSTVLVSGFLSDLGNKSFDSINTSFYSKDFNWEQIKLNGGNISVIHGNNDPYVPIEQAESLSSKLGVILEIIENGGHLNEGAGFKEFPQLLKLI